MSRWQLHIRDKEAADKPDEMKPEDEKRCSPLPLHIMESSWIVFFCVGLPEHRRRERMSAYEDDSRIALPQYPPFRTNKQKAMKTISLSDFDGATHVKYMERMNDVDEPSDVTIDLESSEEALNIQLDRMFALFLHVLRHTSQFVLLNKSERFCGVPTPRLG
ncbi:hypothetical protein K491DRAFT_685710 [Lophiostoma macrostomum CBS 122681]|uniref:Uncharacterized protein n=1 Tax=Lophiostoma macrostomum CBS 122681 TaxID=1314788 RepID=A0A6A6SJQ2_9PLEO|nr:hypothetical protein K491DRAFT_685710 [Lophiostoma macrostomum CBS 122681]